MRLSWREKKACHYTLLRLDMLNKCETRLASALTTVTIHHDFNIVTQPASVELYLAVVTCSTKFACVMSDYSAK